MKCLNLQIMYMQEASDFFIFIGRFHPLVVHLPIGFVVLAAILEFLTVVKKESYGGLTKTIAITYFSGGVGAALSAIIGYLLSVQGGYDEQTLFWHKWLGITLALLSFLGWAIKSQRFNIPFVSSKGFAGLLVVLISITGHLGGNLTHGSDYLTDYAPNFVKSALGIDNDKYLEIPEKVDSILVYAHLIQPVLDNKCVSCHNATTTNGNLRLDSPEGILKGGSHGTALVSGKPMESHIFERTILPQSSVKFMPPNGEPLTYSELKILEWWINEGASFEQFLISYDTPKDINHLLLRDFGIDTNPKSYFETLQLPAIPQQKLEKLNQLGWRFSYLSNKHNVLDVSFKKGNVSSEMISNLTDIKAHVTWLDLSKTELSDDIFKAVGQLENLTRLNLSNTNINDTSILFLNNLKHVEVLNLYGTEITDESLQTLVKLDGLKRVYLWGTHVSDAGVESLKSKRQDIKAIGASS